MPCPVVAVVSRGLCTLAAVLAVELSVAAAPPLDAPPPPVTLTNLFELRQWADHELTNVHPFRIVAEVCDVDPAGGVLALRDGSGVEFIRLPIKDQSIKPGVTVSLEAEGCSVKRQGFGLTIVPRMVLESDGVYGIQVRSSTVFLHAGLNPITVDWFNHLGHSILTVEYDGPGVPRQQIPSALLSRAVVNGETGITIFSAGLDYQCYEGTFESLADFAIARPTRTGFATNFDVGVRTRSENAGVRFDGFLTMPRDGVYTFRVSSDDGSRLFVGQPSVRIRVLNNHAALPEVTKLPANNSNTREHPWVTVEGTINFVALQGAGGELQMRVGNDDIRGEVFEGGDAAPNIPLYSKVQVSGIYLGVVAEDGSRGPGVLRVLSWKSVRPVSPSETHLAASVQNEALSRHASTNAASLATSTNVIVTVADIKALAPESAKQELPVSIRGVVTTALFTGAVVQDSTRGIYIFLQGLTNSEPLQRGDIYQIDGVTTPGFFAPSIMARKITHLGAGQLPHPLHATWDQLVNGSLDTEYAEMEGVVTAVHEHVIELLAQGGKMTIYLNDFRPEALANYENALVRIRGCFFANFNEATHKLEPGLLRVGDAAVEILQPAPRDMFDAPRKSIAELLLYDPKATPFRLLKVNGQVIYSRSGSYYLADGTNGLHVTARNGDIFAVGDLVDAVGFLELGGPAAELKEALMRKTGRAPLPAPAKLSPDNLLLASSAATLVRVDATLVNHWSDGSDNVLDLQSGFLAFRGRIWTGGRSLPLPPSGSQLELTGVYAAQGDRLGDGKVNGLELLLHSPADIRVLATPPWWNLKRMLILAGILGGLLCAALIWNKELQWKVQERTRQLELEIRHRQKAELQRAAEAERSRIARDLHDELGSGLTEVSLLASSTAFGESRGDKRDDRFGVIAEKARALVSRLDVIVWAIDPKRNSLQAFADYVGSYAKEFFAASDIVCRLKIPIECGAIALGGAARHSLFLAIKESLNNIIRHAAATEVELQLIQFDERLEILITDNGCGFDPAAVRRGHGLANLQQRLEALRGECCVESQPGKGTIVKFVVPLGRDPE
jgi:signal transduction histidine kinase